MSSTLQRLQYMVLGWGAVGAAYFSTGYLPRAAVPIAESFIDPLIPFSTAGVWLYLSFFALIPFTYLSIRIQSARWLMHAMQISALICGVVFIAYPTTLLTAYAAPASDSSLSTLAWRALAWVDTARNCLPSLHAALTLLCSWALIDWRQHPWRSILAIVLGLGILYSIVQLRRHLAVDLGAGLVVGIASGILARQRPRPHRQPLEKPLRHLP